MGQIFLYGAAGTSKTVIRHHLSELLDYPLLRTEDIKDYAAESALTSTLDPVALMGVKEAWRRFGKLSEANVAKGLRAMRTVTRQIVDAQLAGYENVIVEGTYLDPEYSRHGPMFLFVITDEGRHEAAYFRYRPHTADNDLDFMVSRLIQSYLISEATEYPVKVLEVPDPPQDVLPLLQLV